jgi:hypothetical protein
MNTIEALTSQEIIELECNVAESKKDQKTLLLIKNEELYHLAIHSFNEKKNFEFHQSMNILYFELNNKKYFTDKLNFLLKHTLENGKKEFGIAFIGENNAVIAQWFELKNAS